MNRPRSLGYYHRTIPQEEGLAPATYVRQIPHGVSEPLNQRLTLDFLRRQAIHAVLTHLLFDASADSLSLLRVLDLGGLGEAPAKVLGEELAKRFRSSMGGDSKYKSCSPSAIEE